MQYTKVEKSRDAVLNLAGGLWRVWVQVLAGVLVVEWGLLFEEPGAGLGACAVAYGGILLSSRRERRPRGLEWILLGVLLLSAVQSARFTGFSNVVVMGAALVGLNGLTAYRDGPGTWRRLLDGLLTFLRPIGVARTLAGKQQAEMADPDGGTLQKGAFWLRILFPALVLVLVFGVLLTGGNAVMGKWIQGLLESVEELLSFIELPGPGRLLAWAFFGGLALVVVCPARPSRIAGTLTGAWGELGSAEPDLRRYQWLAALLAMNLLFGLSSLADVLYLWMEQELPAGVTYSRYLHKGVYALVLTTVLSAIVLGYLTRFVGQVRKSLLLPGLAGIWMLQNLFLISGVYLRLLMYVEAYGQTPKRVYVMLFLFLVLCGYLALGYAIFRGKPFRWLVAANICLVFGYFFLLQLFDVPGWVARHNLELYLKGEVNYPEDRFFRQIGSHSIVVLAEIRHNSPRPEDRARALDNINSQRYLWERTPWERWPSFQYRDYVNYRRWLEFSVEQANLLPNQP